MAEESGNHLAPFVFGALAVVAVAGLVVAMTPRAVTNPLALSATTMPPAVVSAASVPGNGPGGAAPSVPTAQPAGIPMGALLTSFAAFPHAVTSGPHLDLDGTGIANGEPDADDVVLVRTDAVTYRLPWGQVPLLDMPDGTVVFTVDGDLLAHVRRGELVVLSAD